MSAMLRMLDRRVQSVFAAVNVRLAEWAASWLLMAFAVTLALPGDTLATSAGGPSFAALGLDETALAVPIALIAGLRMAGLIINGHWRRSPVLRLAGAAFGCSVFTFLSLSYLWPWLGGTAAALSPGASTFAVLAVTDLLAAYRAGQDARLSRID